MFRLLALILSSVVISAPSFGAQSLYTIEGKAVDSKNIPIPGATVRLSSKEPGPPLETLTEVDGTFSFSNLPGGTYEIVVEMPGFQKLSVGGIDVASDPSRQLTLTLKRPEMSQSPSQETTTGGNRARAGLEGGPGAENGQPFQEVGGLPEADGQRPPGSEMGNLPAREENADLLVISGNTTASLAAGDWNDPQFRERITEMAGRMGFGTGEGPGFGGGEGEFGGGRFVFGGSGGGFRGGRGLGRRQARLNGSVFSTYGNSAFNARPYSITGVEVPKPLQIQNDFGASVGGTLPWGAKASTGNRRTQQPGMWFFSYEGTRNRNPFDVLATVPTELERTGDFSQTSLRAGPLAGQKVTLFTPFSTVPAPFPDGHIPASMLSPAAVALLKYIPLPNLPGSVQNFTLQRGLLSTSDAFSARINTRLSSKDNVFLNYNLRSSDSVSSQTYPGFDTDRTNRSQSVAAGGIHRFSPRLIMNYRAVLSHVKTQSTNPFSFVEDVEGKLGIEGVSRDPINFGIPNITFTNYGDLQLAPPSVSRYQTVTLAGGLNKIGNKHSIRVGGDFSWNQRDNRVDANARGTFDYTGFASSAFDSKGRPIAGTGYDFADFLLGFPYSTSRRFGSSDTYLRNKSFNIFVQDNWKVRPNLTLNLGLRYEYLQPFYEEFNRIVTLDVAPGFREVAQVFPDQEGPYSGRFPRSLLFTDKNNFGPRIGIAWKPKASSHWVFRAGYGLFYNPSVYPYVYSQLVGQPPFAVSQSLLTTLSNPLTLQNGFPVDPNVTILNTYAIDPFYKIGYVQQWNFNIQTQLFKIYTLEAGYNASKGTGLDLLRAPNRAPPGVSPGSTEDNRVISDAGQFVYQSNGASSVMHGLQLRLSRRFSHGFRMVNSYTFGKSIDDASGIGGGNLVVVQDENNIRAERSLSSFDQRHRFTSEFNIEIPIGERRKFFSNASRAVLQAISGWNINGSYSLNTGTPLTARILGNISNNSGSGSNQSERPDSTGISSALPGDERTTGHFFNTQAFAIPAPGVFGNAGRYTIPGPGTNLLNLSLRKSFRLDDNNRRIEFRWLVTNVLNHPNFSGVGTVVNALNFGRVTGGGSMRQIQLHLRINF